jgi:hypothetical protein
MFGKIVLTLCVIGIGASQVYVKIVKNSNIAMVEQCIFGTKNKIVL